MADVGEGGRVWRKGECHTEKGGSGACGDARDSCSIVHLMQLWELAAEHYLH